MKRVLGQALLLVLAWAGGAAAATSIRSWQEQLDQQVQLGYDRPDAALATLQALLPQAAADPNAERAWWLARGLVEARSGREPAALASAQRLDALQQAHSDPMAGADAELVRAVVDENGGRLGRAAEHAQTALVHYEQLCGKVAAAPRVDCDHRARWRAMQVLASRATAQGIQVNQRQIWQAAAALAHDAQDLYREAWSLALLASAHASAGEFDAASRLIQQANRMARLQGASDLTARLKLSEARVLGRRGDAAAAREASEEGARLAREAGSPRLEALFLTNLSDDYVNAGQPQRALRAVERALPTVRRYGQVLAERTLLHNASLARLGLGQLAGAKKDFEHMLTLWESSGEADQATVLREFGSALANAGDLSGALELYHRERKLAADIMARNRDSAVRELQARYEREAKQRSIELLERDNALKTARIGNRALLQRVWTLLAATLVAATAFAVLLYLRVRETQRQLEHSHARLRVQSERDALTGLANRRYFQDVMRQRGAHQAFEGSLLLVDIDHFKHVNDRHGHAAGDEVLVEVARRLADAVRSEDVLVRWGGEEFLVFAPALEPDALEAFAERLLRTVAAEPVACSGPQALRVTVSIGQAHFPLAPSGLRLTWEQAVNFIDMALYTAKSLGRNRAVGIVSVRADDVDAMRAVEQDFERAWTEGTVVLHVTEGP
ncbi:GGDEF domain-containing protein [Ideonella sp. BN130291]|uniref:GGDEF domain-containing protein n=1 Tax=Ideonella sp. BN130291 TaxID=3112940 RepID=UPI002E26B903|nr:GGDEF domain-containing protein [Ideonella sp. BN130291]